eukprot:1584184-Prymnesium_polylepis.1
MTRASAFRQSVSESRTPRVRRADEPGGGNGGWDFRIAAVWEWPDGTGSTQVGGGATVPPLYDTR